MDEQHLKRNLGLIRTTMMGVGGSLSAANFVIIGEAAGMAGYAIIPIVVVCGFLSLLTMFSYAELGTAIPLAGGEYTFAKVAYGGFTGFLTGWFEWLSNMFYTALSAIGFAYVVSYLFPQINIPLTAVVVVIVFAFINLKGTKETATAETIITIVVLAILAVFVIGGLSYAQEPQANPAGSSIGILGIFAATAYLFELYLGAEAVAAAQAEVKNPGRNIPLAIVLSAVILIVLYTSVVSVAVGIVRPDVLSHQSSPIAFVAEQVLGPFGAILITIGLAITGLAATNEAIMAQSRVLYAMSRDGYLPKGLCKVHKRYCTPHVAIIVSAIFTVIFAATGFVNFVVYAVNLGFIIGFSVVNLSVIKLRKIAPHLKRPFKAPLYPLTPIAGIAASVFLVLFIEPSVLVLGFELIIVALLVYYIKMIGHHRIRIAFGGISLGLGGFTAFVAYLLGTNAIVLNGVSSVMLTLIIGILVFVSVIQLLAGMLSVTSSER
ncbi:amino acid permease [Candidatus Bathyarchaeota archaeon A05DMB-2]|nr:amino acid permease [Candidatus Bathyarchaeota archaeon A05DMB-2]